MGVGINHIDHIGRELLLGAGESFPLAVSSPCDRAFTLGAERELQPARGATSDARGVCMASQQAGRVAREASRNRCRLGQAVEAIQTGFRRRHHRGPRVPLGAEGWAVQPGHLPARFVADVVKRYAIRAGLDPAAYAGHSLRAGMITSRRAWRLGVQDPGGQPP